MSRHTPLVAGNWKMNTTVEEGIDLAHAVAAATVEIPGVEVVVLPPFTHLWPVAEMVKGWRVGVGSQDVFWEDSGPYTGEISPAMLDGWCQYVLTGHSERRHILGETNVQVNRKVRAALQHDLRVIVAVGETGSEREDGETEKVVVEQLDAAFDEIDSHDVERIDIAYEPVWAIGTGVTATPEQAQEVCALIRGRLRDLYPEHADDLRIVYGGSVTGANAAELFAQPDIDGGLIGGASLKPQDFAAIVAAAAATRATEKKA